MIPVGLSWEQNLAQVIKGCLRGVLVLALLVMAVFSLLGWVQETMAVFSVLAWADVALGLEA